jgi:hypothetical protein
VTNVISLDAYRKDSSLPKPPSPPKPLTVGEAIAICLRHPEVCNAWEAGFLASIRRLPRLTPKQLAALQRLFDKVCAVAESWP